MKNASEAVYLGVKFSDRRWENGRRVGEKNWDCTEHSWSNERESIFWKQRVES